MNRVKLRWFGVERHRKQGCLLSPLLFNFYVIGMMEELESSARG